MLAQSTLGAVTMTQLSVMMETDTLLNSLVSLLAELMEFQLVTATLWPTTLRLPKPSFGDSTKTQLTGVFYSLKTKFLDASVKKYSARDLARGSSSSAQVVTTHWL
jgi:hypothetical protein